MGSSTTLAMEGCNPHCKYGNAVDELKLDRDIIGNRLRDIRDIAERNSDHASVEEARDRLKQLEIDNEGGFVLEAVRKNCQQSCAVERTLAERPNFGAAIINKMATLKNE